MWAHNPCQTNEFLSLDFFKLDQKTCLLDSWATEVLSYWSDMFMARLSTHRIGKLHFQWERIKLICKKRQKNFGKRESECCGASGSTFHQLEAHCHSCVLQKQMLRWGLACWVFLGISAQGLYTGKWVRVILQGRGLSVVFNGGKNASS